PLTPIGQHYTVKARANNTQELNLLIDTGDSSSISLNPNDWSAAFPVEASSPVRATVAGLGNHVVRSKIARLHRLQIQEHTCGSLHATAIQNPASLSHLGLGFFRRDRVIFDCPRRRLYLRPGQQFASRETEDMSGLHLLRQNDSVVVHSVDPGSPAAAQKLNAGDVILSVNGQPAFALALRTIRQQLQSGHGNRVTLRLRQGTEFREVDLLLKRMI
ncbi:MAG TPA: PDZ domain-containing protein, partial [Verrucomicrobiae bacterium]|nr:PDZ domain-containing protein [Verrucomicrobiae bacterium]